MTKLSSLVLSTLRPWLWFSKQLEFSDMHTHPMVQFARWYRQALRCFWLEFPDAVCLSSQDKLDGPDSRMVLLKDFDTRGFVFFSNYESVKARQLEENPLASMNFFWDALQKQVRVKGAVTKISEKESDLYFASRPRESQIGAWASIQSEKLDSRASLLARFQKFQEKFSNSRIPRPPNWGGYRLAPTRLEFWKAGRNRLHDRIVYSKNAHGLWVMTRLHP